MRRLVNFWRLPAARRVLFLEAVLSLILARLALQWLPFTWLTWFFQRRAARLDVAGAERERRHKEVRWAINMATWSLPAKVICFPRAIAAQAMLRRRGVPTTLYYGAAIEPEQGLTAHVWLQDGTHGIVGHLRASRYHVLARYPELY